MNSGRAINAMTRGVTLLGFACALAASAHAQDGIGTGETSATAWQRYDWLAPSEAAQRQAASGESFHATSGQSIGDPFTVLSTGVLWQDKTDAVYTRQLDAGLSLSSETSSVGFDTDSEDFTRAQKVGVQFQPADQLTLGCNLHDTTSDSPMPGSSTATSGGGFSAESHLPTNSVLTLGVNSDRTSTYVPTGLESQTCAYDAQISQPIGHLPLSAILKGHYEGTSVGGAAPTNLPSLEQSLVWKPLQDTTIQAGLRQQQYQEYPGVDHELNEALFADWSQRVMDDVSWHSYAEVLNSRGLLDQAPASAIASGANGTPQANNPLNNASVTSSLPISIDDQTLTFSTGPSFKLQQDISASVEYSNRWDKNPAPGSVGQEQRVSVSVKGTF